MHQNAHCGSPYRVLLIFLLSLSATDSIQLTELHVGSITQDNIIAPLSQIIG